MRKIIAIGITVFVIYPAFGQKYVKYGEIPYGISIESFLSEYGNEYIEARSEHGFSVRMAEYVALRSQLATIIGKEPNNSNIDRLDGTLTRVLRIEEKDDDSEWITNIYFLINDNTTKLFMVEKCNEHSGNNLVSDYQNRKTTITNILNNPPQRSFQ
jgi:hypothetical protein